jgi:hypothetical protein
VTPLVRRSVPQLVAIAVLALLVPSGALASKPQGPVVGTQDRWSPVLAVPIRLQADAGPLGTETAGVSCAAGQAIVQEAVARSRAAAGEPVTDAQWDAWVDERIAAIDAAKALLDEMPPPPPSDAGSGDEAAAGDADLVSPEAFAAVAETCLREAYELCRDAHEVQHVVVVARVLEQQRKALGIPAAGPLPGSDFIPWCLSFRLEFRSEAQMSVAGSGYTTAVKSTVDLKASGVEPFRVTGSAALKKTKLKLKLPGCKVTVRQSDSTFDVDSLVFEILDVPPPPPAVPGDPDYQGEEPPPPPLDLEPEGAGVEIPVDPRVSDLELAFAPGKPKESAKVSCPGGQPFLFGGSATPFWFGAFALLHQDEFGPRGATMSDWRILGGDLYAEKTWSGSMEDITEKGSMKLYHTPE